MYWPAHDPLNVLIHNKHVDAELKWMENQIMKAALSLNFETISDKYLSILVYDTIFYPRRLMV